MAPLMAAVTSAAPPREALLGIAINFAVALGWKEIVAKTATSVVACIICRAKTLGSPDRSIGYLINVKHSLSSAIYLG